MIRLSDKKLLVVCGDSWMTPTHNIYTQHHRPNQKHFSQILAERLNWDVICLGNVGFSNLAIAEQIKTAASINPNLVIFNTTSANRYEFLGDPTNDGCRASNVYNIFPILKYIHPDYNYLANLFDTNVKPYMVSAGLVKLDDARNYFSNLMQSIEPSKSQIVYDSLDNLYEVWKNLINYSPYEINESYDRAVIFQAYTKLVTKNIPFICMLDYLCMIDDYNMFDDTNYTLPHSTNLHIVEEENKNLGFTFAELPHYHTIQSRQYEFANRLLELIEKQKLI